MAVDVACLVVQISEAGDGFPVVVGWRTVVTEDVFVVLLPCFEAVPSEEVVLVRIHLGFHVWLSIDFGLFGALADGSHLQSDGQDERFSLMLREYHDRLCEGKFI